MNTQNLLRRVASKLNSLKKEQNEENNFRKSLHKIAIRSKVVSNLNPNANEWYPSRRQVRFTNNTKKRNSRRSKRRTMRK